MTVITSDYDIPGETARPPAALVALLAVAVLAVVAQCVASAFAMIPASEGWWRAFMIALHVALIAGPPALGAWAYLSLSSDGIGAARPVAHFLRLTLYLGLVSAFTTRSLESTYVSANAFGKLLWLARMLVIVGLPVAVFVYLKRARPAVARYGRSFAGQVADMQMRAFSREGAICVLLMVAALLFVLTRAALPSIRTFGWSFLVTSDWRPNPLPGGPKLDAEGNAVRDPDTGETVMNPDVPPAFGALPLIWGTFVSSLIALAVAVPLSFGAAIFLVRVAPRVVVPPVSFLIEFLAAIPSIAYGIWGIFVLAPFLQRRFEPMFLWAYERLPDVGWGHLGLIVVAPLVALALAWLVYRVAPDAWPKSAVYGPWAFLLLLAGACVYVGFHTAYVGTAVFPALDHFLHQRLGFGPTLRWLFYDKVDTGNGLEWRPVALTGNDLLCGGLILAIMIVPIITAISRDVLRAVPRAQVEGTTALGATWWQSSKEMLKFSRSALFGAVMLGLARAAGETMAVTMVIGNNPQIKLSPFMAAQTMSSLLANQFAEANEVQRSALFEVALILLVMSLAFNVVARYLVVGKESRSAAAH